MMHKKVVMGVKKYRYVFLLIFFIAVGVFFSALYITIKNKQEIHKNGLSSVGTLFDVKSKYLKVRYVIGGEALVFGTNTPFQHLQNGEEYLIKYLENDLEYINVHYSTPIFSDHYQYNTTNCRSIAKNLSVVTFEYLIAEKQYVRNVLYKEGDSLTPNDYMIKYRVDNPKIGYLIKK